MKKDKKKPYWSRVRRPFKEAFFSKVKTGIGCWIWTGATASGYGVIRQNRKLVLAHRAIYELIVGKIPKGLQIDHLCQNTICVNPKHLEPVTPKENMRRYNNSR